METFGQEFLSLRQIDFLIGCRDLLLRTKQAGPQPENEFRSYLIQGGYLFGPRITWKGMEAAATLAHDSDFRTLCFFLEEESISFETLLGMMAKMAADRMLHKVWERIQIQKRGLHDADTGKESSEEKGAGQESGNR